MIESQDNNFELQAWGIRLILLQGQRARQEFPGDYFYLSNEISNIWASCKRYSLDVFMEWKEEADSLVKVGAGRDQEVGNAKFFFMFCLLICDVIGQNGMACFN